MLREWYMVCGPNSMEGTCAKASRRQSKKFTEHIDAPIHLLQKIYQILYCIHQILKGTLVNILLPSRAKASDILKTLDQQPHSPISSNLSTAAAPPSPPQPPCPHLPPPLPLPHLRHCRRPSRTHLLLRMGRPACPIFSASAG